MAREGIIRMSVMEVKRAGVIQQVIRRELKQVKAAEIMGLSERQVRRLVRRVEYEGVEGLIHRSRGRPGSRVIEEKEKILKVYDRRYSDFGPTLASEKLLELDKLKVNHETLREWLLKRDSRHEWRRKKRPHKKWRSRKECFGEMVQMDGSHHDWLEGRGRDKKIVLMGYVDDATGDVFARFYKYEGVRPALDSMYGYIEEKGIPQKIYIDKHSTYKTTRHQTISEQLINAKAMTQFQRAMKELGVDVIHANSAPAKGRIERLFKTFQDRVIKEMRLAGVRTLEEANEFLKGYLPKYNKRFSVPAKLPANLHRKKPMKHTLDAILCIKERRSLRKDSTVHYNKRVFLINDNISRRTNKVFVEDRLDGSIRIRHKEKYLKYKEIDSEIALKAEGEVIKKFPKKKKKKKNPIPSKDHPWRQYRSPRNDYKSLKGEKVLANV